MLLKAIPSAEQQELVTDRALSSTAILYKLMVRFQPGGAGEKQILLKQLTSMPKASNIQEVAAAIRNWRRHFGRAEEVQAVLPDGILLLKALDEPLQKIASMDQQAAFRLSQSRMQLQLDERPDHRSLWSFSQCLLAEAETLTLLQTAPSTASPQTPLKLKQMQGDSKPSSTTTSPGDKAKAGMMDKPCKYFISDTGCKAGKSCRWLHSWEGVEDRSSRCWICGGKDHRKNECKLRTAGKKQGEPGAGPGGGRGKGGGSDPSTTSSTFASNAQATGGKAGAAAMKVAKNSDESTSTATVDGGGGQPEITSSTASGEKDGGRGGGSEKSSGGDSKTAELLHEATQLLKTLRVDANPKLKVMQLSGVDQPDDDFVLLDSGATHGLRPARDAEEWQNALPTSVQLADGVTEMFRLKRRTKILLSDPSSTTQASYIIPMGGLSDLDFSLEWRGGVCRLHDDAGREIQVTIRNGCPMISRDDGCRLLEWLELFHVHQLKKLAMVQTLLTDPDALDKTQMDLELSLTAKLRELFPDLPDEVMMKLVPNLDPLQLEDFGARLPWNRRKRRRVARASNIVIHVFAGDNPKFWENQLSTATTEVICVDLLGGCKADLMDRNVYGYLLQLAASGRVRAILGGPPCRTVSALRFQQDGGPRVVRNEEWPYGVPDLSTTEAELVMNDVVLLFRYLSLYVVAEDVRRLNDPVTQFILEQPEDPARYRSAEDVAAHGYMSIFRAKEWRDFQKKYNLHMLHFDQGPMGHERRKPTTLGTSMEVLLQLDGLRGEPSQPVAAHVDQPLQQRIEASKRWASWAPGLKLALATAIKQHLQMLDCEKSVCERGAVHSPRRAEHVSVQQLRDGPGQHNDQISVQSFEPHTLRSLETRTESPQDNVPTSHQRRDDQSQRPSRVKALGPVALEQWRRHYLNDHLPARRDCAQCVRAQARSKPHRRVQHPDAFTLSIDLSGRLSPGDDQQAKGCRYMLIGCYTYPVTRDGKSLLPVPGQPDQDVDHPLPGLDIDMSEDDKGPGEDGDVPEENIFPEEEEAIPEGDEPQPVKRAKSMNATWMRLVETATDVTVRQLTFVQPLKSRAVKHLLPALSRIYARLRSLGLPVYRLHSDRARELTSAETQAWALDRNILTTMTCGSSYKSNGRCEAEVGVIKKSIRILISSGSCTLTQWPLAARHLGERRLRGQLSILGWPVGRLVKFGAKAYALRKSWQSRYAPWREDREEVQVLGPDANSSLTNTGYYVRSVATGRHFFTDDIIIPEVQQPAVEDQVLYLPERAAEVPARRQRRKAAQPAISMFDIEGERTILERCPTMFEPPTPSHHGASSDSWSLETTMSTDESTPRRADYEEEEWWSGGGDEEGVPNSRAGGAYPRTPQQTTQALALRRLHLNVTDYIREELQHIDASSTEQALWMPVVTEAIINRVALEERLLSMAEVDNKDGQLEEEFLVTRTVGNKEVWENLSAWEASIRAEYQQLVVQKEAVKQMPKSKLYEIAERKQLPIELLPGKMVHTRKAGSGAYRSRAVVCGNYQEASAEERYAGGADGNQIRMMLRTAALQRWALAGTDVRVAFLNAPKRNVNQLTAMEVPYVFKKLGLASASDVWLIEKALYGLVASPRDWCIYRDEVLPTLRWTRSADGEDYVGRFAHSGDDNMWRLMEVNTKTGQETWAGLMSVYVDDLLVSAKPETLQAAMDAVAKTWTISAVEWASTDKPLRYCGFEVLADEHGDGFQVSQKMFEQELLSRWAVSESLAYPAFKINEEDELVTSEINQADIKSAQALTGALLWLSTRTRPDLVHGVSVMSRLVTKNPKKSLEIGHTLLKYLHGNPGGIHFPNGVANGEWGARGQLKVRRHSKLLEVYADIAYAAGSNHRSVQGLVICYAGVPVAWQCNQQPFVTHSTAEAELVSYCEALLAGRASEALLCAIWGEDLNANTFERVMYGDNAAAIGLAHGVTAASWRTRHLRIRSSILKEALQESSDVPGGRWQLTHLKGTELVADGCTKPLNGQAFFRFLEDLGLKRGVKAEAGETTSTGDGAMIGGGGGFAAVKALVIGSTLISAAQGASNEDKGDIDFTPFMVTGSADGLWGDLCWTVGSTSFELLPSQDQSLGRG